MERVPLLTLVFSYAGQSFSLYCMLACHTLSSYLQTYGLNVVLIPVISWLREPPNSPVWVTEMEHGKEWDEKVGSELENLDYNVSHDRTSCRSRLAPMVNASKM